MYNYVYRHYDRCLRSHNFIREITRFTDRDVYPFDSAATGLPTRENGTGSYIMFAGTPWAHLMIYQNPNRLSAR